MSVPHTHSEPPSPEKPKQPRSKKAVDDSTEVVLVQQSQLFYWWPVWAVGFLMALITFASGSRMATVPPDTVVQKTSDGYTLTVKGGPEASADLHDGETVKITDSRSPWHLHMSSSPYLGLAFAGTLLAVILLTNIPLRGLWSALAIVVVLALVVVLTALGVWRSILDFFLFQDIHINAGGYLFIALPLFLIWVVTVFWLDRQHYVIFSAGQVRVCEAIGSGEKVYDAGTTNIERLPADWLRHRLLGLGSGDLILRPSGAPEVHLDNVLWVSRKVRLIEEMKREHAVVPGTV